MSALALLGIGERILTMSGRKVRVEKTFQDRLCDLLSRNTVVVPCFHNQVDGVFHDGLSDLSGRLIQDQSKVILAVS